MKFPSIVVLALLSGCMSGCQPDPSHTQINAKLRSPDGVFTAIYAQDIGGGPATGVFEDVYIVDGDRFPRIADRVFGNECVHNVQLTWEQPTVLRIEYSVGQDIHEETRRDDMGVKWPWLFGRSPARATNVHLVRHLTPPGNGC